MATRYDHYRAWLIKKYKEIQDAGGNPTLFKTSMKLSPQEVERVIGPIVSAMSRPGERMFLVDTAAARQKAMEAFKGRGIEYAEFTDLATDVKLPV